MVRFSCPICRFWRRRQTFETSKSGKQSPCAGASRCENRLDSNCICVLGKPSRVTDSGSICERSDAQSRSKPPRHGGHHRRVRSKMEEYAHAVDYRAQTRPCRGRDDEYQQGQCTKSAAPARPAPAICPATAGACSTCAKVAEHRADPEPEEQRRNDPRRRQEQQSLLVKGKVDGLVHAASLVDSNRCASLAREATPFRGPRRKSRPFPRRRSPQAAPSGGRRHGRVAA